MMTSRTRAAIAACAVVAFSGAATAKPAADERQFNFDPNGYVRMHAVMNFTEPNVNVFTAEYCPSDELLGFDFKDLVKGSKTVALTAEIDAPGINRAELNLYNIVTKKKLFGRDCKASFQRIDFSSPLYLGGQYDGTTISVTPKLLVADEPGQLFSTSLNSLLAIAGSFSQLPAPFLANKDKYIERVAGQFSSSLGVQDTVQLTIGANGRHEQTWTIPGNAERGIPGITFHAYIENVSSYFTRPASGWDAGTILARNFPSGSQFGFLNFADMVQSLGGSYVSMVAADNVDAFNANCMILQRDIGLQGLSPMDRSLLLWAVVRNRVNLRDNPAVDHTQCMASTYQELARFDATKDIKPRSLFVDDDPPDTAPASELQMRVTTELGSRLALFWKAQSWPLRRSQAEKLFAWPVAYSDQAGAGLLDSGEIELMNPDQWQTRHAGGGIAFADQFGCYLFQPASGDGPSDMLALASLAGQSNEVLVRFIFDNVAADSQSAPIRKVELLSPANSAAEIALLKSANRGSCGQSWQPASFR